MLIRKGVPVPNDNVCPVMLKSAVAEGITPPVADVLSFTDDPAEADKFWLIVIVSEAALPNVTVSALISPNSVLVKVSGPLVFIVADPRSVFTPVVRGRIFTLPSGADTVVFEDIFMLFPMSLTRLPVPVDLTEPEAIMLNA